MTVAAGASTTNEEICWQDGTGAGWLQFVAYFLLDVSPVDAAQSRANRLWLPTTLPRNCSSLMTQPLSGSCSLGYCKSTGPITRFGKRLMAKKGCPLSNNRYLI